ncbi:MAG TPA: DUF2306 domain-containing protein [Allosphingosinicella sp.]|nr:DUF2306 domain-containing protein [Allosphingosinicella sp.]
MASVAEKQRKAPVSLKPDLWDRVLASAAIVLLVMVCAALARGYGQWQRVPLVVWGHILTIVVALALTPVMLLRRRGDRLHRRLGWVWAGAMLLTAVDSLFVRGINAGSLSLIHIFSFWTLVNVPLIVWSARTHNVAAHRASVRGMIFGALVIAGIFTFPFNRLMGHWLFG